MDDDDLDDEPLLERDDFEPEDFEPPDDFEPEDFEAPDDFEPALEDELERDFERDLDLLERELRPPPRLAIMNFVYNAN